MSASALRKALAIAGSQAQLARRAIEAPAAPAGRQLTQQSISKWLLAERPVPAEWALAFSQAVGYQVTPHELRGDVYPNADDALPRRGAAVAA